MAILTALVASFALFGTPAIEPEARPKVAIYPWTYSENEKGTSQGGIDTAEKLLRQLFTEKLHMEILDETACTKAWIESGNKVLKDAYDNPKNQPALPSAKQLLQFGKKAGADFVCAGKLRWKVKSIWVALGPKTKATAYLDCRIINVKNQTADLDVKGFCSDSTRAEKWYETAGSILVTWGITVVSGGPKTPHMQRAAIKAIGGATNPFVTSYGVKATKIK